MKIGTIRSCQLVIGHLICALALITAMLGCLSAQTVEALEPGIALTRSTTKPYYACPNGPCDAIVDPPTVEKSTGYELPAGGPLLQGSGENGGFDPADLQSAYKIPTSGGAGQTVAIVDAYGDATAESDLASYRGKYGLEVCTHGNGCFKKVNEKGEEGNYPEVGGELEFDWRLETSLDMDMVSAACPHCHILLVEANTQYAADTGASVNLAATLGATEISNSYGYPENYEPWCEKNGCASYKSDYNHPGIPVTVSAGDDGYRNGGEGVSFPASTPTVIAVGGTALTKASNSRGWTEEVWNEGPGSETGSGCSEFESKPTWQTDTGCAKRTENDVSAVAACKTPVSIYDDGYWENVCGTSASSPLVAGIEAHATVYTRSLGADAFYLKPSALFDVSTGSNGTCTPPAEDEYLCTAKVGYDGPTGLGTPDGIVNVVVPPTATTGLASSVTETTGTLNGTVNANGLETKYYFEYGTTTSYGSKTAEVSMGEGVSSVEASRAITSLLGNTTYHFRIVATSSGGTSHGADQVFTTHVPTWSLQTTPSPGAEFSYLKSAACTAYNACIAVGHDGYANVPLAERWNGTEWSLQTIPGAAEFSELNAVACSSGTCIAVGTEGALGTHNVPLAERWNGTAWSLQTIPSPTAEFSELKSVSCTSATACTAVGVYGYPLTMFAEHWNGTAWSIQSTPNPTGAKQTRLYGVSCSTAGCTAVGAYENSAGFYGGLVEHWNGTAWTQQEMPSPTGSLDSYLNGVSCQSTEACTAVGGYLNSSAARVMLAEHWNGTEWKVQTTPNPTGAKETYPMGVSCAASSACTATGSYVNSSSKYVTLGEEWTGTEWKVQTTPNPIGAKESRLEGISCMSSTECVAVGNDLNSSSKPVTLGEIFH